jgi:hypothetical protein
MGTTIHLTDKNYLDYLTLYTADTISATTFTANTEFIIGQVPTGETGSVLTDESPRSVYVQGKYAYVVNSDSNSLQIFDVSNPSLPTFAGSGSTGTQPYSVYVQGKYAYVVNTTSNSLQIFDVSDPSSPVSVGSVLTDVLPYSVYVQGKYAYVVNNNVFLSNTLQIFDVSNPSLPVLVGTVGTDQGPNSVYVQGKYAYVVNLFSGTLQIFDVSDPSSPVSVGTVGTGIGPYSVYVQGKYAYVVNPTSNSLQIFDVSNPSSPTFAGSGSTDSQPTSVYVQGKYVYVVNNNVFFSGTLQIFDVSDPSSPVSVGTVPTDSNPLSLYVQGKYVYVVNQYSFTLQIFDVGGSYIQQLEAGGILTSTFESIGNATIGNDLTVVGGLSVSQSTNIQSDLSVLGNVRQINTQYSGDVTTYHLKVSLTAAQIQSGNTVPIDIGLPASGVGYYWRVKAFDVKLNYGTVAFNCGYIAITATSKLAATGDAQLKNEVVDGAVSLFAQSTFQSGNGLDENSTISILTETDSVVGDSTIDCYISVQKIKL